MSADNMTNWRTGIAEVVSTDTEEEVLIRGRRLSELIGLLSFAEMMFLLLTGKEPTKGQARVLDALLVASIEHGIAPPSMIARCFASYGTSIQAAMAGGIMAFGDTMGGAGEQLAKMLSEEVAKLGGDRSNAALQGLAKDIVGRGGRIPGYGIPLHGADPRSPKMLSVAREEGCFGPYCRLAELIEQEIERASGKSVPLNLDGVGAAVILDLGFPWQLTRMFLITPRSVSFAAHYFEEQQQGTKWRHLAADDISYDL
jgi:citrate synthase